MSATVSIIIPTACRTERASVLARAIDSVLLQEGVAVEAIVVVNGSRYDESVFSGLRQDPRLRIVLMKEGNVSLARYGGLRVVTSEFFGFLDDDDELLPGSIRTRVSLFREREDADVVATNGYRHADGKDAPLVFPGRRGEILADPGESLLRGNWFASPAPLFRARTVPADLFNFPYRYLEMTYLFFLLLSRGVRFHYDESFSYRVFEGSELSASRTLEYQGAHLGMLKRLLEMSLAPAIRRSIRHKYLTALNVASKSELDRGAIGKAWAYHFRCVASGGWRYIPYTRHLLRLRVRADVPGDES